MILQALHEHYEVLAAKGAAPKYGWCKAKVFHAICLDEEGRLVNIMPLIEEVERRGKKVEVARELLVPLQQTRSGRFYPNFLCDNASYLLGLDRVDDPEVAKKYFRSSAELHREILEQVDSAKSRAVLRFFENWDYANPTENPILGANTDELLSGRNLVFRVGSSFVQDDPAVVEAWDAYFARSVEGPVEQCLITGEPLPIARLHGKIKGVRNSQSSGASIVSFNEDAFKSYGKEQSFNSPISEKAAFAYVTTLNNLLSDSKHVVFMGDATVVFWTVSGETAYQDLFLSLLTSADDVDDADLVQAMRRLARGDHFDYKKVTIKPETRFFVLGLSPNAARIAIRFFHEGRFGDFAQAIVDHHSRLEIVKPAQDTRNYLSVNTLLFETVNKNAKDKSASPLLAGALLRSILTNSRYPAALFNGVMMRIRAEKKVTRGRAAIIKAFLMRNYSSDYKFKEVLTVKLNEDTTYQPYVLGRLFAMLESIQERANPGINTTIKDRYFNSACSNPEMIFPVLFKLSQTHLKKIDGGLKVFFDKRVSELTGLISESYPKHHSLEEQGAFQLGYYHQRQKNFEKKQTNEEEYKCQKQ